MDRAQGHTGGAPEWDARPVRDGGREPDATRDRNPRAPMTKGELTRTRLLRCAEIVFSEKGYHDTRIQNISKMGGVAKGTIYQYFKNKEEIFIALLASYLEEWEKAIAVDLREYGGDGAAAEYALAYLRRRIMRTAEFCRESRERTNLILRVSVGANRVFEPLIRRFENAILDVIIHDIRRGQKWGTIPRDIDAESAGNAILGAVLRLNFHYFVLRRKQHEHTPTETVAEGGAALVAQMLNMK